MADEVVPGVFVGGLEAVQAGFDGSIICVLEACGGQPPNEQHVPVLMPGPEGAKATPETLESVCQAIDEALTVGPVLVHCGGGVERSPLSVAWWLHSRRGMALPDAYQLVALKHPPTQDRTFWIV
jgi:protein-tyrosine phosphatase